MTHKKKNFTSSYHICETLLQAIMFIKLFNMFILSQNGSRICG